MGESWLDALRVALPLGYLVTFALCARGFITDEPSHDRWAAGARAALLVGHASMFAAWAAWTGTWPLGGKGEFLSLVALALVAVHALAARGSAGEGDTGVFYVGAALPFQIAATALFAPGPPDSMLAEHPIYGVHVLFLVVGFTALAVGALDAGLYLLLSKQLKSRSIGLFFRRLPPLIRLEREGLRASGAGLFFLGAGLALGHAIVAFVPGASISALDPKVIVSDVVWVAYVAAFAWARARGLGGRRAAYMAIGGFAVFLAAVALTSLFAPTLHNFSAG